MVQIIEENRRPSLGQKLSGAIGTGLEQGAKLYGMHQENEALKKQGIDLAGIQDPEIRKLLVQSSAKKAATARSFDAENQFIQDKYGIDLSGIEDPTTRQSILKHHIKEATEKREKETATAGIKSELDWLDKNIMFSGKPGVSVAMGGPESHKGGGLAQIDPETGKQMSNVQIQAKREEIKRSGIWVADAIYTHFNKGVLNKEKWNDVKNEFAVDPDLPPEVNRARMAAAKRIMALPSDIPSSVAQKEIDKERKALEKIEKSKGVKGKERPPLQSFYIEE